jgi:hypothetical protein
MYYRVAEGLNVASLVLLVFLLVSFLVLPAEKTRRHYLSYCLIVAAMFMALGFVIPLGAKPEQCYNEITPNDMYSSLTCAFSGAFLISGGLSMAVWSKFILQRRLRTVWLTWVQFSSAFFRCISKFAGTSHQGRNSFTGPRVLAGPLLLHSSRLPLPSQACRTDSATCATSMQLIRWKTSGGHCWPSLALPRSSR